MKAPLQPHFIAPLYLQLCNPRCVTSIVLPCYTTLETSAISQNSPRYGLGSTEIWILPWQNAGVRAAHVYSVVTFFQTHYKGDYAEARGLLERVLALDGAPPPPKPNTFHLFSRSLRYLFSRSFRNPKPQTPNPKPRTPNPKPQTPNTKP